MRNERKLIGTGILAAIASSLCCITPAVAFLAGVSGIASAFTWIEPIRPFLMAISVFALGFAWYKILKPKKTTETEIIKAVIRTGYKVTSYEN